MLPFFGLIRLRQPISLSLIGIVLLALSLRLWGINHQINTDENKVVTPSALLAHGEQKPLLYPRGSYYPHLYHYILASLFLPLTAFDETGNYATDYQTIYLLTARILTALIGTATVWLLCIVGRKLVSPTVGLLAALFLATLPLHIKYSHYAHVDIPLTFFALLTVWAGIHLWKDNHLKWYIITAIAIGLSASIHFPGFTLGIVLLLAHSRHVCLSANKVTAIFRPAFLLGLLLIPLTFAICNPYLLRDWQHSWESYQKLNSRALTGDLGYTRTNLLWPLYTQTPDWGLPFTRTGLVWEINPLLFTISLLGIIIAMVKKKYDVALLLGGTAIIFYLSVTGYVRMTAIKRLLPITPLITLLAAFCLITFSRFQPSAVHRGWVALLGLLIIGFNTFDGLGFDAAYDGGSTHAQAIRWAETHVPEKSVVLQHGPIMLLHWNDPRFTTVRLNEVYASFNPTSPEVSHDRAKPLDQWIAEKNIQFIALDSRMVDRYYDSTSMDLYPETTASYQNFFNDIRDRGHLAFKIDPKLWSIAGPRVEIYDVRHLNRQ